MPLLQRSELLLLLLLD